jgi:hypothetical protein
MIGMNELRLCPAEMQVALQEYVDKRMGMYAGKVTDIALSSDVNPWFIVKMAAKPEAKDQV